MNLQPPRSAEDRRRDAEVADRLEQLVSALRRAAQTGSSRPITHDDAVTHAAKQLYWHRRQRGRYFEGIENMFGEAGWDILLDLFIAWNEKLDVSISSACIAADVPATTALRWISVLEASQLIYKEPDPDDRRRTYLRIAPAIHQAIHCYISEVIIGHVTYPSLSAAPADAGA